MPWYPSLFTFPTGRCTHRSASFPPWRGYGWTVLWALGLGANRSRLEAEDWLERRDEWHRLVPFIGAGFSTSISRKKYGTLKDVVKEFRTELARHGLTGFDEIQDPAVAEAWLKYRARGDFKQFANRYLSNSSRTHTDLHRQWSANPSVGDIPFLPLKDYVNYFRAAYPKNYDGAKPDGANLVLARLLREGYVRHIVTTNYDALIEFGAYLVGMRVLDGDDLRNTPRDPTLQDTLRAGTHEVLLVLEPSAAHGDTRWSGGRTACLLKVHGGVRHVHDALQPLSRRQLSGDLFLATYSAMLGYRDGWQQTVLTEAYENTRMLMVGASARDAVTFRLIRHAQDQLRKSLDQGQDRHTLDDDFRKQLLQRPPVVGWCFEANNPPPLELELLLMGPPQLPPLDELPLAHVRHTAAGLKGMYMLAAVRSLARVLARFGFGRERDVLLRHAFELAGKLDAEACSAKLPGELEVWLDLFAVALPRWGTLSKSQSGTLFLSRKNRVHIRGWSFTLPFLNDAEGRARMSDRESGPAIARLLFLAHVLVGLLEVVRDRNEAELLQHTREWYLGAFVVKVNAVRGIRLPAPRLVHFLPLYLDPDARWHALRAVGTFGFSPLSGANCRMGVMHDNWSNYANPTWPDTVARSALAAIDHLLRQTGGRPRPFAGQSWESNL